MPIYEYRCQDGHTFEVMQSMTDEPVVSCERCGKPVERVFHPVAVHFKGSGFYTTDYGRKKAAASSDGKPESKEDGKAEKKDKKEATAKSSSPSGGDD